MGSCDMAQAYQIHANDNVATMLEESDAGEVNIVGAASCSMLLSRPVKMGHKIALSDIKTGDPVIKYGVRIGHTTRDVRRGDWVHLHNLASDLDERSGTLDGETGAPTDTRYE